MAIVQMVMPKMGESVQEGTVVAWKVNVGDKVSKDQILLDIATDKVDTEVPSPCSGTVTEILVGPDQTVEVGAAIALIEDGVGASAAPVAQAAPAAKATAKPATAKMTKPATAKVAQATPAQPAAGGAMADVLMPKMGESVQEGTVVAWKVKVGDKVSKDQILLDIATDKVDTEVPSPATGVLAEIIAQQDQTVEVGAVIARIATGAGAAAAPASAPKASAPSKVPASSTEAPVLTSAAPRTGGTTEIPRRAGEHFYSPVVRHIAKENGVTLEELEAIHGHGRQGRVTKNDLLEYLKTRSAAPAAKPSAQPAPQAEAVAKPAPAAHGSTPHAALGPTRTLSELGLDPARVKVQKMNHMRKRIAQHMWDSVHTSPHVFSIHEFDLSDVVNIRNAVKDDFKKEYGFSLTFTSFIIWAACRALRQYPLANARINGDEILIPDYINFGMAVALEDNGLIVPKIKEAENLTIVGIQRKVNDLALRARDGKLSPDELSGGTFTLTNMGGFGTTIGLPIISQPEVAIMGCGSVEQRPVIRDGGIAVRWMMYASLAYDHRLVDGAYAANFMNAVGAALVGINPMQLGFDRRKT